MNIEIRKIQSEDNEQLGKLIQAVFIELGAPKEGTAYADKELFKLSEVYSQSKSVYFVVLVDGVLKGGCGIAILPNEKNVCELQKMYLLNEARGLGIGQMLMDKCIQFAKEVGFDKCYLETLPMMGNAQKLYLKNGFYYIDNPMGCTGHGACHVFMLKDLI